MLVLKPPVKDPYTNENTFVAETETYRQHCMAVGYIIASSINLGLSATTTEKYVETYFTTTQASVQPQPATPPS